MIVGSLLIVDAPSMLITRWGHEGESMGATTVVRRKYNRRTHKREPRVQRPKQAVQPSVCRSLCVRRALP